MRYGDRFGRVVGIVLLTTLAAMTHAEDAVLDTAAQRALPVERAVVIDHGAFRRLMNGEEGTNKQATSDAAAGILRLTQRTPDKRREWEAALAAPISLDTYPLLVLEYRASNLKIDTSKDAKPLVRIVGTNCNGMAVIKPEQLIADGQPHRIVADLRTLPQYKKLAALSRVYLAVESGPQTPAEMQVLSLRMEAPADAQPTAAPADDAPITVTAVDLNGKPVEGVTVTVEAERVNWARSAVTGKDGKTTVTPRKTDKGRHMVRLTKPGLATMEAYASPEREVLIPAEIVMAPPFTVGGVVHDEQGKPVQGVAVYMGVERGRHHDPHDGLRLRYEYISRTDKDGKWKSGPLPAIAKSVRIWHKHPDYISERYAEQQVSLTDLKDHAAQTVVRKGKTITGIVMDESGKPIEHASVLLDRDRVGGGTPVFFTDAQGQFRSPPRNDETEVVTVTAPGFAPELTQVSAGNDKPVEFRLKPGVTLKGKVVDSTGKPIPNATIFVDGWRGFRTLGRRASTGADGRFKIPDMPTEELKVDILASNYMSHRRVAVTPGGADVTLTVLNKLQVKAKVVDAATGQAVEKFSVRYGIYWDSSNRPTWQTYGERAQIRPGEFDVTIGSNYPGHAFKVDADGYTTAVSRRIASEERNVELLFKLQKADLMHGTLTLVDGKPAAGMNVALVPKGMHLYMTDNEPREPSHIPFARTDAEGAFRLTPPSDEWQLVVWGDQGFGVFTSQDVKNGPITVPAWGRVEGEARIGGKPAAHAKISVWYREPSLDRAVSYDIGATTDRNGKFVFDRIRPGAASMGRYIEMGNGISTASSAEPVNIEPGKTAKVTLGGAGCPVVGRIALPDGILSGAGERSVRIATRQPELKPKLPDNFQDMSLEEKKAWYETWKNSADGKAFEEARKKLHENDRSYHCRLELDGSFRAEDVAAGQYTLELSIYDRTDREPLGQAYKDFTIAPMPGGRSDEPLDLGTIEFIVSKNLKTGDIAADFAVPTTDGKTVKLSDYRGKLVLLDFWATWCGPCLEETPHLKAVHEKFGNHPRFAMIALSLDPDIKAPRAYAQKNGITWTQGFLGNWDKDTVAKAYGVHGIPSIWLIGPDGKILAKNLRGKSIQQRVQEELDKLK